MAKGGVSAFGGEERRLAQTEGRWKVAVIKERVRVSHDEQHRILRIRSKGSHQNVTPIQRPRSLPTECVSPTRNFTLARGLFFQVNDRRHT